MTEKKLLIGSLSNDLYRIAGLLQRGSNQAADRFFVEAKRWAQSLSSLKLKKYIQKIIVDILNETDNIHSMEHAEKFLMYSVLLQNYALHME